MAELVTANRHEPHMNTHRYYPGKAICEETPINREKHHMNTHRYYPATDKDHDRPIVKHNYCDHENEGMDTHTTSSRYVPVVVKKAAAAGPPVLRAKERGAVLLEDRHRGQQNPNIEVLLRAKERGAELPIMTTTEDGKTKVDVVVPHRAKQRGMDLLEERNKKAFDFNGTEQAKMDDVSSDSSILV